MASSTDQPFASKYALEQITDVNTLIYHELRSPLTSIYGALKILESQELGSLSEEAQKLLSMAVGSTQRLTRLTNLLEYQRSSLSDSFSKDDIEMIQLENDLQGGLRRQEFFLNYQPIVNASSGQVIGFEALARWQHPDRGAIAPDLFIGLAERSGFIKELGLFFLEAACQQLSEWQRSYPRSSPLTMNVNLSTDQLDEVGLSQSVAAILDRYNIPPETLKLEITESLLINSQVNNIANIEALKALGVNVYLDDFGTGYSSLNRLQDLPFDALKIDRSFIANQNWLMSEMIIALADKLGIEVIAEGIETVEQLNTLKDIGCHTMQGYFFSRPLDREAATHLLLQAAAGAFYGCQQQPTAIEVS
jgi:EAL domain-containing protein (putative c-di-GMP-specific phosphodiesterase class I)